MDAVNNNNTFVINNIIFNLHPYKLSYTISIFHAKHYLSLDLFKIPLSIDHFKIATNRRPPKSLTTTRVT